MSKLSIMTLQMMKCDVTHDFCLGISQLAKKDKLG